ncbi:hypothetical protein ACSR0Z_14360 [Streptomyces viridosporus]
MSAGRAPLPGAITAGLRSDARRAVVGEILHAVLGAVTLHHGLSSVPDSAVQASAACGTVATEPASRCCGHTVVHVLFPDESVAPAPQQVCTGL